MDILRLAAILTALSVYQNSTTELGSLGASAIAYAAPQAFFALMAFFLWRNPFRYESFLPLYTAGKVISAFAIGAWLLRTLPNAGLALGLGKIGALALLGVSGLVVVFDLISALAGLLLLRVTSSQSIQAESLDDTSTGAH